MKTSKALQALMAEAQADGTLQLEQAKLEFALSLEAQRRRQQLSYVDLAKRLGTSAAYVSKVFRGDSNVTIESMVKLAEAAGGRLAVTVSDRSVALSPWQGPETLRLVHSQGKPQLTAGTTLDVACTDSFAVAA